MATDKIRLILGQIIWMVTTSVLLILTESFSYELYFVTSTIGFLITADILMLSYRHLLRKKIFLLSFVVGLVGSTIIIIKQLLKVVEIL